MDSISQFVLGAAIGEATLGHRLGRKSLIVGGLIGTLPDLDVLVHYSDAVASFTYHRSWSHSLFMLTLVSPVLAWLLHKLYPRRWLVNAQPPAAVNQKLSPPDFRAWLVCVWLILVTHPLLDGFTVYGTQLFWPLPVKPVAIGSIFIIDPLYTVPLIIAAWIAWRRRRSARKAAIVGLFVSTVYLGATLVSQEVTRRVAMQSLQAKNIPTENVVVAPTPVFIFWRIVSMDNGNYHEGFYSLLDQSKQIIFAEYNGNRNLIDEHYEHWPIARLDWFTSGLISASVQSDNLVINDLRMGIESSYVFRFKMGGLKDGHLVPIVSEKLPVEFDTARGKKLFQRVFNEKIDVH